MKINSNVVDNKIGDETVLLNLESGHYFVLNESGALVWNALKSDSQISDISKELAVNFDISEEQANTDIEELFDTLRSKQLIV